MESSENKTPETRGMHVVEMRVAELKPYERNPRRNDKAVEAVAESIRKFGFLVPLVVGGNGEIAAGHTRYKAALRLGMASVPCVMAENLTPAQLRAFRIADNKVAELAEWDDGLLAEELLALPDFGWEGLGFTGDELAGLLSGADGGSGQTDEDAVPEPPERPVSRLGARYRMGSHILMCGDSTRAEDISRLMGGAVADLVVTDPPYNVDYKGGTKDCLKIRNDSMEDDAFREFLTAAFKAADSALKPGGAFYIWHANSEAYNFHAACRATGWKVREVLVWVKNSIVLGRQDYQWKHEPCIYGWKAGAPHYFIDRRDLATVMEDRADVEKLKVGELRDLVRRLMEERDAFSTVIRENKPLRSEEHPTMKPVSVFAANIRNSSRAGETVLDPFGGSGTTAIACEQLRRSARIMELDQHYCDVIRRRWAEFVAGDGCDWEAMTPEIEEG